MTDYNDGKWHGWDGGECPVHPETMVEVVGFPGLCPRDKAELFDWSASGFPVIAFRVTKPYREPGVVWMDDVGGIWYTTHKPNLPGKLRKFVEVFEDGE